MIHEDSLKIAVLGPKGTFSNQIGTIFGTLVNNDVDLVNCKSISNVVSSVNASCPLAVLPIENAIGGYVQQSLDLLLNSKLTIIHEITLPIRYTFIGNVTALGDIKTVFVQYVAKDQCSRLLDSLESISITQTQSNSESYLLYKKASIGTGAIVPSNIITNHSDYPLIKENIADYPKNKTRFWILAHPSFEPLKQLFSKTSIIILNGANKPGELSRILAIFAEQSINLCSIVSRPVKHDLGSYYFFIDIQGSISDPKLSYCLDEIKQNNEIHILGSYPTNIVSP